MRTISIVGVGLIGASFALAIREAGFSGTILGVSSSASIEAGIQSGAIDRGVSLDEAARTSDLLYLSQPIDAILGTIPRLAPMLRPGILVTDAGSTKAAICQAAQHHLPPHSFLGGHPMAGKELRGAVAAEPQLFANRPYVLTGVAEIRNEYVPKFTHYLNAFGARIVHMAPEEHDATVALTSHLPQLLSTALSATLAAEKASQLLNVFGPGLMDMTRLAMSAPEVWMSVLATNREAIDRALAVYQTTLQRLREDLGSMQIERVFEEGRRFATAIRVSEKT